MNRVRRVPVSFAAVAGCAVVAWANPEPVKPAHGAGHDSGHGTTPTAVAPAPHAKPKTQHGKSDTTKPAATTSKPATTKPTHGAEPKPMHAPDPTDHDDHTATPTDDRHETAQHEPAKHEPAQHETATSHETPSAPTASEALAMLVEGNGRWVSGTPKNPNIATDRRATLAAEGQKPFVTVLTCADSRIPVERVFDRGVGEVFVVRVAGNIAGDSETGTVEYGLGHLHTPLLVVMGHTKCGAVAAAASGAQLHGKVGGLVSRIHPAVDRAKRNNPNADETTLAAAAVKENVWQTIYDLLRESDEVRAMVESGSVKVVGAVNDISTGKVDFMGEHPWQIELLTALKKPQIPATPVETAAASEHE